MNQHDITEENAWRMEELWNRAMSHHHVNGLGIHVQGWDCIKRMQWHTGADGSLIYVYKTVSNDIHLHGTFECSDCGANKTMNYKTPMFFNFDRESLICQECYRKRKPTLDTPYPQMCARLIGDIDFSASQDYIKIIDLTHRNAKYRKVALRVARHMVQYTPNLIFLDGKSPADIWEGILARRVLRRFRQHVVRAARRRLAYVIEHVTHVNKETAQDIASCLRE
jgi:hypothetical protein